MSTANVVLPICLMAVCMVEVVTIVVKSPLMIWSPIVWFLLACATYYGLGSLIYHYGSSESREYLDTYFEVSETLLTQTNCLNATGILVVSACFKAFMRVRLPQLAMKNTSWDLQQTQRGIVLFLGLGLPLKYLLVIPYHFGLLNFVVPGVLETAAVFTTLASVSMWFLAAKGYRTWLVLALTVLSLELFAALLTFSKMGFILSLTAAILGAYTARPRLWILGVGLMLGIACHLALTVTVPVGRALVQEGGQGYGARYGSLIESVSQGAAGEKMHEWWIRLSYSAPQAVAMAEYDKGLPGGTFSSVLTSLIPRMLWPEKPYTTYGSTFNTIATGNPYSASSPGIFAEAYWNGGWFYVVAVCMYVAAVFALFTRVTLVAMARFDVRWLPATFGAVMLGAQIDSWFVATFVAGVGIVVPMIMLMMIFLRAPQRIPLKQSARRQT